MKIFDKFFRCHITEETTPKKNEKIDKLHKDIHKLKDNLKVLKDKRDKLENETIPTLVREHRFVDKNYFLPDADILIHLREEFIYFVQPKLDNSEHSILMQNLQHLHYDIHYFNKYIECIEDKIERYNNMLPKFIRRDKLEKLNKRYYKFKDGKKTKYTKYEIKRKILR